MAALKERLYALLQRKDALKAVPPGSGWPLIPHPYTCPPPPNQPTHHSIPPMPFRGPTKAPLWQPSRSQWIVCVVPR